MPWTAQNRPGLGLHEGKGNRPGGYGIQGDRIGYWDALATRGYMARLRLTQSPFIDDRGWWSCLFCAFIIKGPRQAEGLADQDR